MLILGLESSCDETGVALIDSEKGLLAHAVHTQIDMHRLYGGVVPELASRDHIRRVIPLIEQVLEEAGKTKEELNAIAVTQGPGLAGALLVGVSVAHALAFALDIPVIGIHHMEGHLLANLLADPAPQFPFIALLVSGGHTQIMKVNRFGDYELLGDTLDDAVDPRFGRAGGFVVVDLPDMTISYIDNGASQTMSMGAGIETAERVARAGVEVVLSGYVGPKAFEALTAAGIKVCQNVEGISVGEAVERFRKGEYPYADAPNK